jgi:hypothetical protein
MAIAQEIKVTLGIIIPFVPLILSLLFFLFLLFCYKIIKKENQGRSRKNWVNCKDFSV